MCSTMSKDKIIPSYDLYKTLDSLTGFEFSRLEETYNPYDASLPHRHNYYEIFFFKESGGTHEIDFASYPILDYSLHFISPEQVHLLRRNKQVTGFVLAFTKEFCSEEHAGVNFIDSFPFFNNPYSPPVIQMKTKEKQNNILDIISKIQSEYSSSGEDKAKILSSYLSIFLISAKRMYEPRNSSDKFIAAHIELTRKFKLLVEKNFREMKLVSGYADMLNITAGHLNDTVHADTGKTASEIIHERIILEAKRLLYHSPKSVKEIAYELLYDDPSYFVRFFKTHAQLTPEEFRKHIRDKYH